MLGGDNRRYRISPEMAHHGRRGCCLCPERADAAGANTLAADTGGADQNAGAQLGAELGETNIHIVSLNEANPYPGILGVADAIIVTSDSVNMASEAAITGKPVLIAGGNAAAGATTDRWPSGPPSMWGSAADRRLSPPHDRRRPYRSAGSRIATCTLYRAG